MDELSPQIRTEAIPRRTRHISIATSPQYVDLPGPPSPNSSNVLRHRASLMSVRSDFSTASDVIDRGDIVAPVPRRHLLQTSEAHKWLQTPLVSPVTSRAHSPITSSNRHVSFSALLEHEMKSRSKTQAVSKTQEEGASMGKRWVRWMHKSGNKEWISMLAIGTAACVKWAISLGSYSGEGKPPMYGDYEAQRHWMELTLHLPIRQWYTYDLQYWGLDYPPLTAYVSWTCGIIGSWINPDWFALDTSRGMETPGSKVFMRSTVWILDAVVYVPALLMFVRTWQASRSTRTQELALFTLLFQPALLLVDFGHFQYNSVMLGFALLAVNFLAIGQDVLAAFFFVLSMGFKQMAIYYAPAIGSYLLGKCLYLGPTHGTRLFLRLGVTTLLTFLLLFLPFLPPFAPLSTVLHPITRIFPFNRGLFEDKVANLWCATNVLMKWRAWLARPALLRLSTLLTAIGFMPAVVGLIRSGSKMRPVGRDEQDASPTPTLPLLPYALLTSSLSFFLFSFQVHEKTILVPLLPMMLLLSGAAVGSSVHEWGVLMNNVGVFSMWPLLKKDGQGVQYTATLLLWNRLIGCNPFRIHDRRFVSLLSTGVYAAAFTLHVLELVIPPPARYPDLYPTLNVLISMPVFALVWLWSIKCGMEAAWALGGLGQGTVEERSTKGKGSTFEAYPLSASMRVAGSPGENGEVRKSGWRQGGERAMSLGYAQGRKKKSTRSASLIGHSREEL